MPKTFQIETMPIKKEALARIKSHYDFDVSRFDRGDIMDLMSLLALVFEPDAYVITHYPQANEFSVNRSKKAGRSHPSH